MVDPEKFDFYAMDCHRLIGDNSLAELHAREIVRKTTAVDGAVLSPMRKAEGELTLGVIAARNGELQVALDFGNKALAIDRRSQPSPGARDFHNTLIAVTSRSN